MLTRSWREGGRGWKLSYPGGGGGLHSQPIGKIE